MNGVSVVIKALNEEANIARAIESALAAVASVGGEVVLADALSEDRTVAIARRYPITIAQLAHREDRGCGSGPQLGFQHARAEFIYLMDGDMELRPGFIEAALAALRAEPRLAGVGGILEYLETTTLEYRMRAARRKRDELPGYVSHLSGGGLYRAAAIREVGYFSNRNLHAWEELELGLRLGAAGWRLKRIDRQSVAHHCPNLGAFAYVAKRWRGGHLFGAAGELVRSALGKSYLPAVLRHLAYLFYAAGWMVLLGASLLAPLAWLLRLALFFALLATPVAAAAIRRRSVQFGFYIVPMLCLAVIMSLRGALRSQRDPFTPIESRLLQQARWIELEYA
jgi:glycosyltransferase involved in cell wall biosynthesis